MTRQKILLLSIEDLNEKVVVEDYLSNSNVDRLRFSYVKILIKKKENSSRKILFYMYLYVLFFYHCSLVMERKLETMVYFTYLLIHIFFIFLALLYGLFLMFFNPLKLEEIHQNSYSFDGLLYAFLYHRYASTLQLTEKIDIFSFGVVLLEALCGLPPILKDPETENGDIHIVEWV